MKRVMCLYRVSIKGQVEKDDIPMQRIACREFIATHSDWILYDEKLEKGVSGFKVSAAKRDKIIEIREAAEKKLFDILLVFMADRLGRRDDETPFLVEWFVSQGIEVWSVKEGQIKIESHTDKLINYIRFWQASGESLKTSTRVSTRQEQMVLAGIWRGGARPFGYDLIHQGRISKRQRQLLDLVINEAEATIVREIFDLYCNHGHGTYLLANYLNAKYPNPQKIWSPKTILSMLRNPLYTGKMHFNSSLSDSLEHLRIVSDEQFDFAQRIMKENIPIKYRINKNGKLVISDIENAHQQDQNDEVSSTDEEFTPNQFRTQTKTAIYGATLLSGLLYCAHCEHKLVGTYHTKINAKGERVYRPVYRCYNGAVKARNCDGKRTYSAKKLEDAVLATVRYYFSTFKTSMDEVWHEQAKAQLLYRQSSSLKTAQNNLAKLLNRQKALKAEAIKALTGESVYAPEMVQELLLSVADEIAKTHEIISKEQSDKNTLDAKLHELSEQYKHIHDWADVFDDADTDAKKMILARIIKKIVVDKNYNIIIHFFLTMDDFKKAVDTNIPACVSVVDE